MYIVCECFGFVFFFKQKTAYEMRISDWSSDVCSSDLLTIAGCVDREMFESRYAHVYKGDEHWQKIEVEGSDTYQWRAGSTYVANPPYFEGMTMTPAPVSDIVGAKPLAILGDSIKIGRAHV